MKKAQKQLASPKYLTVKCNILFSNHYTSKSYTKIVVKEDCCKSITQFFYFAT